MKFLSRWLYVYALVLLAPPLFAGNLKVTISPSAAASAGAEWRVDGGVWRSSGTTAKNLANGSHTVDFKAINGWIAPAPFSVTISGGTTSRTATYTRAATLRVDLTPSSGQWRINSGAWQSSGATVASLAPGEHTISYRDLPGYAAPMNESVNLTAGQSLTLSRTYTVLPISLTVQLSPPGAQWNLDGGPWQEAGATLTGIAAGTHTISYSDLDLWLTPPPEVISLAPGDAPVLQRDYAPEPAELLIELVPAEGHYRIDGGTWIESATSAFVPAGEHLIEYAPLENFDAPASEMISVTQGGLFATTRFYTSSLPTLRVDLTPASGQWRLDGGAWQTSGATLVDLFAGPYTLEFADIGGEYEALPAEIITLAPREHTAIVRAYALKAASLTVQLVPSSAQWRLDDGAWQPAGAMLSGIVAGTHTIRFQAPTGYAALPDEAINLTPGQAASVGREFVALPASLTITLEPASGSWGIYREGDDPATGTIHASGETVSNLASGSYVVEYIAVSGYTPPPPEVFTLAPGESLSVTRSHEGIPALISITTSPSSGQWRIDEGTWRASGSGSGTLLPGTYTIDFLGLAGYDSPAPITVTANWGDRQFLAATYTAQPASVQVNLTPAEARWRVDGGAWDLPGAVVAGLTAGSHTIDYLPLAGYAEPAAETIELAPGENHVITRDYQADPSVLTVNLNLSAGRWRADAGDWHAGGSSVSFVTPGDHTIDYQPVPGYATIPSETVYVDSEDLILTRNYTISTPSITVNLTPSSGQWRLDYGQYTTGGGPWQSSGATLGAVTPGAHYVHFHYVSGYTTPAPHYINVQAGQTYVIDKTYQVAPVTINWTLDDGIGQWRANGGAWQNSGATVSLPAGTIVIDFIEMPGYDAPAPQTYTLNPGNGVYGRSAYTRHPASVEVNLIPATAKWRLDGGEWQPSGAVVGNLSTAYHWIEYSHVDFHLSPPNKEVVLGGGENRVLTRNYTPGAGDLLLQAEPLDVMTDAYPYAFIDDTLFVSFNSRTGLAPGRHTVSFSVGWPWTPPQPVSVEIVAGEVQAVTATFTLGHPVKFFIDPALAAPLTTAELQSRLAQYFAVVKTVFDRETVRRLRFDPATDIVLATQSPFVPAYVPSGMEAENPIWIHAVLTDEPVTGTYGGNWVMDNTYAYAVGVHNMRWDQIHDPATVVGGTESMRQFWLQNHTIVRELMHAIGTRGANYATMTLEPDLTGVAPLHPEVRLFNPLPGDPFWSSRSEYLGDPLLANNYANPRVGSPVALPDLIASVRFSPLAKSFLNGTNRSLDHFFTLPYWHYVPVCVIDAVTGTPVEGAAVRVWSRGTDGPLEQPVDAGDQTGEFWFSWRAESAMSLYTRRDDAKLLKAWAPGYEPTAQWEWAYDAQSSVMLEGASVYDYGIIIRLNPL